MALICHGSKSGNDAFLTAKNVVQIRLWSDMRIFIQVLFGISIIANGLLLFWGREQRDVSNQIDGSWKDRDHRRVNSIHFLSSYLVNELTKEKVISGAKSKNRDYYEKDGALVLDDLTFSFGTDGLTVVEIQPFIYEDK